FYLHRHLHSVPTRRSSDLPNEIITSPDGITWTERTSDSTSDHFRGVAYGAGKYVVVGIEPNPIIVSTDGITWNYVSSGVLGSFADVIYTGSKFVALAHTVSGFRVSSSTDGITWSAIPTISGSGNWMKLVYG